MRKRSKSNTTHAGLAILAGAFSFAGTAGAAVLVSEGFEGSGNIFSTPTYAYSLGYTGPNLLSPGGGINYMHGGNGINGQVSSNSFPASTSPISLLTGGITAGGIDGGTVSYNLYAQFSSYLAQGDYGLVRIRFLDAAQSPIGSFITVGGSAFVNSLGTGAGGLRDWGADTTGGILPFGARFVAVSIDEVKGAQGINIDGYVDNISFSIVAVPEPGTFALFGLGGGLLWVLRRRR